jgi:hypothetical protein
MLMRISEEPRDFEENFEKAIICFAKLAALAATASGRFTSGTVNGSTEYIGQT